MTEEQKKENIDYLIKNFIDTINESETLAYPLFIPSCHNRKPSLLDNLNQFLDTKIYVFIYEHEVEMYEWLQGVTKVIVPKSYLTIQKMRVFMQNYAFENGIKKCWVSDDDMKQILLINKTIKTTLARGMRIIEKYSEGKNWPMTSPYFNEIGAKFWDGVLENPGVCGGISLFDWEILKQHDIKYTGDVNMGEDIELLISCFKAGLNPMVVRWMLYVCYGTCATKNSIASKDDLPWIYCMNLYKKFGDFLRIKLNKDGTRVNYYPNIQTIIKNSRPTWKRNMLEACGDVEKFKAAVKETYSKKSTKNVIPSGMTKFAS